MKNIEKIVNVVTPTNGSGLVILSTREIAEIEDKKNEFIS